MNINRLYNIKLSIIILDRLKNVGENFSAHNAIVRHYGSAPCGEYKKLNLY